MNTKFQRALSNTFIQNLASEAAKGKGWWSDVLADDRLLIAVRDSYLNVYWHGQSLICVTSNSSGLKATTHQKYLMDPQLASQVELNDGKFDTTLLEKASLGNTRTGEHSRR